MKSAQLDAQPRTTSASTMRGSPHVEAMSSRARKTQRLTDEPPNVGEALYANMGHFGDYPVRVAWFSMIWPAPITSHELPPAERH